MKRLIAFILLVLVCSIPARAEEALPAAFEAYLADCQAVGLCLEQSVEPFIKADANGVRAAVRGEGFSVIYNLNSDRLIVSVEMPPAWQPWAFALAFQSFAGLSFEDAARLYFDCVSALGDANSVYVEGEGIRVHVTNGPWNIEVPCVGN